MFFGQGGRKDSCSDSTSILQCLGAVFILIEEDGFDPTAIQVFLIGILF